jgi:hypothetical protein
MTKFQGSQDPGYQSVSGELWIWAQDVRRQSENSDPPSSCPEPRAEAYGEPDLDLGGEGVHVGGRHYYQGAVHHNGLVIQGSRIANFHSS